MNAHSNDLNFSRRELLKGGGAMIVGFSLVGLPAGEALAARGTVAGPFDMTAIDTWIAVHADNTATVFIGKGEFGQGATTGLLQIAAEELDLDMSQMKSVQLDTNVVTNQGATVSSASDRARRAANSRGRGRSAAGPVATLPRPNSPCRSAALWSTRVWFPSTAHPTQSVTYGAVARR